MTITVINTPTAADALPTVIFKSHFRTGVLAASTEAAGYLKENVATEATNKAWSPTALPATLSVDMTTSTAADCFSMVAHNCGTSGNTILVQTSPDNSVWTTRATIVPTDNTTIAAFFNSVSARYWRINVSGGTVPFIGVLFLGARLTFPAGVKPPYTPIWQAQTYELMSSMSLGGQFLGNRVTRKGAETAISLVSFDRTFGETTIQPFKEHYNSGQAFTWVAGPTVFTKDVGYCWRQEGSTLRPTFDENGSWLSVTMEVNGYGE